MSGRSSIGFYSPFLTPLQKASLRQLEEGLSDERPDQVAEAMTSFLEVAFTLTRDAVLESWPDLSTPALLEIRDDEGERWDGLRQLLWNGDEPSPVQSRLLAWHAGPLAPAEIPMTVEELNNYLVASVDFYECLAPPEDPLRASGEGEVALEPWIPSARLLAPADEDEPLQLEFIDLEPVEMAEEGEAWGEEALDAPVLELLWERPEDEAPAALELPHEEPESLYAEADPGDENPLLVLGPEPQEELEWEPEGEWEPQREFDVESVDGSIEPEPEPEPEPELELDAELEREGKFVVEDEVAPQALGPAALVPVVPSPRPVTKARAAVSTEAAVAEDGTELMELSSAPSSPLEKQSHIIIKKKYLGYGKNSDGVMGYCGQLTLSRFDDQELTARLESSNPLLFLTPTATFGAKSAVITYWMPPAAFPQPSGHLSIKSADQSKALSVGSLFPQSRTDFLKTRQVLMLLFAPALLGLLYFGFVYALTASSIVTQVQTVFPDGYAAALAGSTAVDFRSEGVGLYQLEVVPGSESLQLIWAALIWLCPLLSAKFFRHLSRSRQRSLGAALAGSLLLPNLGLLAIWRAQRALFPIFDHADFEKMDLRYFLSWSVPLNVVIASYLFLSVHGVWDRKVKSRELRFMLPLALTAAYLVIGFVLIFGRSWLG